ncbi:TPA: hypothetical protein I7730_00420 [Vibrio vulnificus]|uniref:Uncharacterized protein n=1 Tax=Vibrio vulnificus TaxID=672 RepID=A0A8H9K6C3_VIBVL|nr:hypothetical protein [Vibrio vulnificus]
MYKNIKSGMYAKLYHSNELFKKAIICALKYDPEKRRSDKAIMLGMVCMGNNEFAPVALSQVGQIQEGDILLIQGKNHERDTQVAHVDEILDGGDTGEEIIINSRKNYHFGTSKVLEGTSWAKEVHIVRVNKVSHNE